MEEVLQLAKQVGFTCAVPLNIEVLMVRQEVRDMCTTDRCQSFGRSWSCPPACGSLEYCAQRIAEYDRGVLVQTTGSMEDDFDAVAIGETYLRHKKAFETLVRQTRSIHPNCLPLTAGTCTLCRKCTYPGRPCRFPGKRLFSMEAYGLLVSDVCIKSGVQYNYGPRTTTYTSCILFA